MEKRHEKTMISHWFPWSFGQLEPVWVSPSHLRRFQILWPQTSAPSTASAGVVQNSTFSSRASYTSRSCHNCVVVDLQNQTFNDVENICVHRMHMFILWLHAEMEKSIEIPSKLIHACTDVFLQRECVYYISIYIIYMFTSYHIMYSWYFLIFLVHSFTPALATPPVVWRIGSRPALACRRPQLSWLWQTNLRGVWTIRNADFICSEPVETHERWESRPTKLKSNHSMRILNMA